MKKTLKNLLFASLLVAVSAFSLLLSRNTLIATKSFMNVKSVMNVAVAQSEDPNFTHHFCWNCGYFAGHIQLQVECQDTGTPGCWWADCSINYACENI